MNNRHESIKKVLKVIGPIFILVGIALFITTIINMTSLSFDNFGFNALTGFGAVGCLGLGSMGCAIGYGREMAKYGVDEYGPVAKDVHTNYIRPMMKETVKDIKEVIHENDKVIVCPKCGASNQEGSKFCDQCGKVLVKTCPS
ncbi:MAG: zinc ribbon domain-containing protein, partial [Bacilli bacterium]